MEKTPKFEIHISINLKFSGTNWFSKKSHDKSSNMSFIKPPHIFSSFDNSRAVAAHAIKANESFIKPLIGRLNLNMLRNTKWRSSKKIEPNEVKRTIIDLISDQGIQFILWEKFKIFHFSYCTKYKTQIFIFFFFAFYRI